jgi:hypothetical protein
MPIGPVSAPEELAPDEIASAPRLEQDDPP